MRTPGSRGGSLSVIGALVAAAALLLAGVLIAVYEEQLYSAQQVKNVREQAQILAASVTAAIMFDDRRAAQEYVDALTANPELQAAGVYDGRGHMLAGFDRVGKPLPAPVRKANTAFGQDYVDITVPAVQNGAGVGTVVLRAITEPLERNCRVSTRACKRKWRSAGRPKRRCGRATKWRLWASFPAALRTTSTI
jgi:hypothetical protein